MRRDKKWWYERHEYYKLSFLKSFALKYYKHIVNHLYKEDFINEKQKKELKELDTSITNMLKDFVISVDKIEGENKFLYFLVKMSKNESYNYYDKCLQQGAVIKIKEDSYLSSIKHKIHLSSKNQLLQCDHLFDSLKVKPYKLLNYGYDYSNVE